MMKIIAVSILMMVTGGGYGFLSAVRNQNPHYSPSGDLLVSQDEIGKAWSWQPSVIWLPSYILCVVPRNGFGISHTRSGYLFRSAGNRTTYNVASTTLGVGMGSLMAIAAGLVTRTKRRSNQHIHLIAGKPGSGCFVTSEQESE